MIRMNLLGEKVDKTALYLFQLLVAGLLLFVTLSTCIVIHDGSKMKLDSLRAEELLLKRRLAQLEKKTKQVEELEKKRKLLREKLQTIAVLKTKKHGPVHILDDLNMSLPQRAWLRSVKEKGGAVEVKGIALDEQTIASYMNTLSQQKLFGPVELVLSTEYTKDQVKLKEFTLSITLKSPIQGAAAGEKKEQGKESSERKGA